MVKMILIRHTVLLLSLVTTLVTSCNSPDERLADYAQRASAEQARQNQRMAQQSEAMARQGQELTAAAHQLVEQDAAARRELIQAQDSLQRQTHAERTELDRQRLTLEADRSAAAAAAVRAPVIAQAVITGGLILAALLPLLATIYALKRLPEQDAADELLTAAMFELLVSESSSVQGPARCLTSDSAAACLESRLTPPPA